jgi:hypothetical protein
MILIKLNHLLRQTIPWTCLVAAIAVAQVACDDKPKSPSMPTEPGGGNGGTTSVVISNVPTQPLDFGDSVKLRADLKSADGTSRDCTAEATWTASDTSAVELANGTLTVIGGSGPVTVKATCSGVSTSVTIPIDIRAHIIKGVVTDAASGAGIDGAFVQVIVDGRGGIEIKTDASGAYTIVFVAKPTTLSLDVRAAGYTTVHQPIDPNAGRSVSVNISLQRGPAFLAKAQGRL